MASSLVGERIRTPVPKRQKATEGHLHKSLRDTNPSDLTAERQGLTIPGHELQFDNELDHGDEESEGFTAAGFRSCQKIP